MEAVHDYTFQCKDQSQLDELLELWGEQVTHCDRDRAFIMIAAHPQAMDEFLLFYDLLEYMRETPAAPPLAPAVNA